MFLDEFGHIGPFIARNHPQYKTSPVFGMAGFMIDSEHVRDLSTWFHKLKCDVFAVEIEQSGTHPSHWEKKGNQIFTHAKVYKYKRLGQSLINNIKAHGGKIIYQGLEKYESPDKSSGPGMYKTVLSRTIRAIEKRFAPEHETYAMILDQHNDRNRLLVGAQQTMYAKADGARWLMEPPYQVESHMYPSVQMADWIASIVGSMWNFKTRPDQFPDEEWAVNYFESRVVSAATHSSLRRISNGEMPLPFGHPA